MSTLGKRLIQAATEARSIARGEADPRTYRVHVPPDVNVAKIRAGLRMTQAEFAATFGFPAGTLRDWEQGRRQPDTAARAYLLVIANDPKAVQRALEPKGDAPAEPAKRVAARVVKAVVAARPSQAAPVPRGARQKTA